MNMTEEKQKQLTGKRWLILTASCLINLCIGSLYAWSVFAAPMAEYFNSLNKGTMTTADLAIVFTLANSVGPITLISGGYINDRLGPRWVIAAGGVIFGGGMFLSGLAEGMPVVGLCFGAFMGVFPGFTADQFGTKHSSVNYGIMFIGFAAAGYVGPTIMSTVYGKTGSYVPAFWIAIGLAVVGLTLSFVYRKMQKQ